MLKRFFVLVSTLCSPYYPSTIFWPEATSPYSVTLQIPVTVEHQMFVRQLIGNWTKIVKEIMILYQHVSYHNLPPEVIMENHSETSHHTRCTSYRAHDSCCKSETVNDGCQPASLRRTIRLHAQ
ncbi:hypothetical protein NP493_460g01012 [Ridgeia piscesae]|uniref:Uncharacterized protein n=1 Tax=Ridgeia piscesae TaxID=27915 RepID=A0AAD9NUN1_RIDPI|nr:hypothetical protein NP493_460g01012 [Ridgeia piscesae]